MAEEIIINVSPYESRVAVVEQGLLQEIFIERIHKKSTVGNIYRGKVVRVLPGLQSAFVAIGHARAAFMHITDIARAQATARGARDSSLEYPPILEMLHEGQEVDVQVTKEPIGTKGARITTKISIASRYLVYLPDHNYVGISQRIEEEGERERLKNLLAEIQANSDCDGFIIRTASEGVSESDIRKDAELLKAKWKAIEIDSKAVKSESLIYEDLPLPLRVMRDIINQGTNRILVDDAETANVLSAFLHDFIPDKNQCLQLVSDETALFDSHNLEDQIEAALDKKVPLKSGGYLVVDQTEAMTTVDVNSGAYLGRNDLEETIYRTNLEAASAIPRQLRLRNIGGIVIIDFIDMLDEEHKRHVLRMLEKGQHSDRVKWNITEISELGLVEMTRKRTHESLMKMVCEPCEVCNGRGFIKTAESICLEIFREIQRKSFDFKKGCLILASQSVIDRLLDEDSASISQLSSALGAVIKFQVETSYSQEQYDVVLTASDSG
ncbi:MAG: Rne/Rng family ribonuclease [Pseudomonadales bacterium]